MAQAVDFTAEGYHSYDGQASENLTRVDMKQEKESRSSESESRIACDQGMSGEAKDRMDRVRNATRQTRPFAHLHNSVLPINSFRPNTRGHRESFLNKLRDHYEARNKKEKIIRPLCTYSGARNLPSRLFQEADSQQQRLLLEQIDARSGENEEDTSYSQITPAPKDGDDGCMNMIPKTWTRADMDAGMNAYQSDGSGYTAAPSGGYMNASNDGSQPVRQITYYSENDGDTGVPPGAGYF